MVSTLTGEPTCKLKLVGNRKNFGSSPGSSRVFELDCIKLVDVDDDDVEEEEDDDDE